MARGIRVRSDRAGTLLPAALGLVAGETCNPYLDLPTAPVARWMRSGFLPSYKKG
jgi:hypothetical protein